MPMPCRGRSPFLQKKFKLHLSILGLLLFILSSSLSASLTCKNVSQIAAFFLRSHFSVHEVNDDLAKKTLNNYLNALDPGKVFFLQEDVDKFNAELPKVLATHLNSANCATIIDGVFAMYAKRFEERKGLIHKLIDAKHDFTIDEYL